MHALFFALDCSCIAFLSCSFSGRLGGDLCPRVAQETIRLKTGFPEANPSYLHRNSRSFRTDTCFPARFPQDPAPHMPGQPPGIRVEKTREVTFGAGGVGDPEKPVVETDRCGYGVRRGNPVDEAPLDLASIGRGCVPRPGIVSAMKLADRSRLLVLDHGGEPDDVGVPQAAPRVRDRVVCTSSEGSP